MKRRIPTKMELNRAYKELTKLHRQHLAQYGVKLPTKSAHKWVWLAMLYHYKGEYVHKDDISEAVEKVFPSAGKDQQVRHLKRDGWYIENKQGTHALVTLEKPSPEFQTELKRRSGRLSASDFDDIKQIFNNCCATCGAGEGKPNVRYGQDLVELQQGHRDPDEPSDDLGNIIPQCQFCNRAYRSDFAFDEKGRVDAVASVRPVKKAKEHVKKAIWEYLRGRFGK